MSGVVIYFNFLQDSDSSEFPSSRRIASLRASGNRRLRSELWPRPAWFNCRRPNPVLFPLRIRSRRPHERDNRLDDCPLRRRIIHAAPSPICIRNRPHLRLVPLTPVSCFDCTPPSDRRIFTNTSRQGLSSRFARWLLLVPPPMRCIPLVRLR